MRWCGTSLIIPEIRSSRAVRSCAKNYKNPSKKTLKKKRKIIEPLLWHTPWAGLLSYIYQRRRHPKNHYRGTVLVPWQMHLGRSQPDRELWYDLYCLLGRWMHSQSRCTRLDRMGQSVLSRNSWHCLEYFRGGCPTIDQINYYNIVDRANKIPTPCATPRSCMKTRPYWLSGLFYSIQYNSIDWPPRDLLQSTTVEGSPVPV